MYRNKIIIFNYSSSKLILWGLIYLRVILIKIIIIN